MLRSQRKLILYFFSSMFIVTVKFNGNTMNQYYKYAVAGLWSLIFLANYFLGYGNKERRKKIREHLILMVKPFAVIAAYTIVLWIAVNGNATFGNFTRLMSTILYLFIAWTFASCGFYFFGKKVVNIIFWSGICSYVIGSVTPLVINFGLPEIWSYLKSIFTGGSTVATPVMEVHDLTFSMGLFFLYYAFFESKKEKNHKLKIVLSILMILYGLKRIEILALGMAIGSYIIALRKSKTIRGRSLFFFGVFVAISYGYIYLIDSGTLSVLATQYGINSMGRIGFYEYAKSYFNFSPFFLGTGYTYFSRMWQNLYFDGFRIGGYGIAASIHSDILNMYIEIGFIMMLIWMYYYFTYKTRRLDKKYGIIPSEYYLLSTIFMFMLYLTDNTSTYFVTQMVYFLLPLSLCENYDAIYLLSKLQRT